VTTDDALEDARAWEVRERSRDLGGLDSGLSYDMKFRVSALNCRHEKGPTAHLSVWGVPDL
jgi:hypothetical protein